MKLPFLISLSVFLWIHHSVYAEFQLHVTSSSDTIARLEKRVESNLILIHSKIEQEKTKLDSFKKELSYIDRSKKQYKDEVKLISKLETDLKFDYQIQNANSILLTMIHQLKFQKLEKANNQLKEIDKALALLKKNKLPDFQNYKSIPATPLMRENTAVYDKEISSFCKLIKNENGKIIANEFETFFEYTDPKIATHFKESDFLQCQARFIKTKKEYFLELKFILNSPKASSLFGSIDPGNPSKIDFVNGEFIYLDVYALTTGVLDPQTGSTVYNVQFKLDHEDIRNISKQDIDTITIVWTSGVDQFDICKMDLLRNLFECIQKRKLQN